MGVDEHANLVHVIDFGLSKEFRNPKTYAHIPFKKDLGFTGTLVFASINSHLGLELGRRDDLESLAYTLFFFLWGFLPWQGLEEKSMLECKRAISTDKLFIGLPQELRAFFEHCRSLSFDGKPNYDHFIALFDNLILREAPQGDTAFDWDATAEKIKEPGFRERRIIQRACSPSFKRRSG